MNRIYHRYEFWECFKNGFFKNSSDPKEYLKGKVIELFCNPENTRIFMELVIEKWKYSSEHNLTNLSMNRVAWLGQSACCIYSGTPYRITMEAWSEVPDRYKDVANQIAEETIIKFEKSLINKQLCLNFI